MDILDYFGVTKLSDISRSKNWAKVMKLVNKNGVGKYIGYKIVGSVNKPALEVLGTKGWCRIELNDGTVQKVSHGKIHESLERLKENVNEMKISKLKESKNLFALVNKKTKEVVGHSYDETMVDYLTYDKKVLKKNKDLMVVPQSKIKVFNDKPAIWKETKKISKKRLSEIIKEVLTEDEEYKAFFKKALEKAGKSIPDMSDEEKKDFFNKIDSAWKGKGEKSESLQKKNERFGRGTAKAYFGSEFDDSIDESEIALTDLLNEFKFKFPKWNELKKRLKKFKKFKKPKKTGEAFNRKNKKIKNFFTKFFKKKKRLTEASDDKMLALAAFTGDDLSDISDEGWAFDTPSGEYLVLTDREADERCKEYIEETIWAFNTWFIMDHLTQEGVNSYLGLEDTYYDEDEDEYVDIGDPEEVFYMNMGMDLEEYIKSIQEKYESGNSELLRLIDDVDDFVSDAISADGRGHFLSSYDGNEEEQDGYYIYRTN